MAGDRIAHPVHLTLRRAAAGAPVFLAALLAAAQDDSGGEDSPPMMVEMLTYLLGAAALMIVLVTAVFVFVLVRRAREQRDREALDEARFESEVLGSRQPQGPGAAGPPPPLPDTAGVGAPVPDIVQTPSAPGPQAVSGPGDPGVLQEILAQLRRANLLDGYETYMELHGQPKGMAAVTLRGGKKALVLPRLESEGFTTHQLRRYDCIICAGESGRPVLIQPLAEYIASRFTM